MTRICGSEDLYMPKNGPVRCLGELRRASLQIRKQVGTRFEDESKWPLSCIINGQRPTDVKMVALGIGVQRQSRLIAGVGTLEFFAATVASFARPATAGL